jgi:hypothetical protein
MNENMVTRVIKQTNQCMEDLISTFTQKMKIMEDKMDNIINENTYLRGKVNVVINASIEQNQSLHEKIDSLMGMNKVLVEEIESLKKPKVKKPKPDLVERVRCKCLTKKGEQCRKFCIEGCDTCKQHANIQMKSTTKNGSLSDNTDKSPPDKPDGRKGRFQLNRKLHHRYIITNQVKPLMNHVSYVILMVTFLILKCLMKNLVACPSMELH